MSTALDLVSSDTRRELLQIIKREGSLSVDEAMEALGMARTTVREHLLQLKEKGLLDRSVDRQGRGRPSHRYKMSRHAKMLFPSRDGELMGRFVSYLQEDGNEDLVEAFFNAYWNDRTEAVKRKLRTVAPDDVDAQLEVLREILEEEGFMPEIDDEEGQITIRECNCPFPESVKQTRIPCQLERGFYEAIFETTLDRVTYIPDGNPACTYEVAAEEAAAGLKGKES